MKQTVVKHPQHPEQDQGQRGHSVNINGSESFNPQGWYVCVGFPRFCFQQFCFLQEALLPYYVHTEVYFLLQIIANDYYILNPKYVPFSVNVEIWLVWCIGFLFYELTRFIDLKIFLHSLILYVANYAVYKQRILFFPSKIYDLYMLKIQTKLSLCPLTLLLKIPVQWSCRTRQNLYLVVSLQCHLAYFSISAFLKNWELGLDA